MKIYLPHCRPEVPLGLALLQMLLLMLMLSVLQNATAATTYNLKAAEIQLSDARTPPTSGQWAPVELPYLWPGKDPLPQSIWFRFRLEDGQYQQAFYVWRFSMNLSVWLNGEFLGDGGKFEEPISRNWNRPFLFLLPKSAWHSQTNTIQTNIIYVRLGVYPGWGGMAPPTLGSYDALRAAYDSRMMSQITFNQVTAFILLFTAVLAFMLWAADRRSTLYAIFGFVCLAWSTYSFNNFVQEIPFSAKLWWAMVHSGIEWYAVTLALFAHRLYEINWARWPDRFLLGFGIVVTIYYFSIDLYTLAITNNYLHLVSLGIAFYMVLLSAYCSLQKPTVERISFLGCISLVFIFGIHDLVMNSGIVVEMWQTQTFFSQLSAPILILTMFVILTRRFILRMVKQIDAEYQIRSERERIFADIHDDVGSKVLSLVYAAETESQANLARDALREIRTIVTGAIRTNASIELLFATCQAESQERCDAADIELSWTIQGDGAGQASDAMQYHVQRIVRELMTNCLKHAVTRKIDVNISIGKTSINFTIRDYGNEASEYANLLKKGTGVANIVKRATELKGTVDWSNASPGWRVTIGLPL